MPFSLYVRIKALSSMDISVLLSPSNIILKNPMRDCIFILNSSSPSSYTPESSNGFILSPLSCEKDIYEPPTALERSSYSLSGSIMIISVPSIKLLNASSFTK